MAFFITIIRNEVYQTAKRNLNWTEDKLKRFIKEGRGTGEGKDYKPWLITQDFPSMGIATRVFGKKTNRMHHFFSNTQLEYFYLLEWEDSVVDIREHYPILDLEDTINDDNDLKLSKFEDKGSKIPYIISTTFLVTLIDDNGNNRYAARCVKYASELNKKITLEKLEIERRYWGIKGIDWGIVTNKDINNYRAKNIEWLHSALLGNEYLKCDKEEFSGLLKGLFFRLIESEASTRKVITEFEQDYGLDKGNGLLLFKYLLANKIITLNMNKQINLNDNTNSLILEFKEDWE